MIWVCLKIGYIPNYSHLIGIMIINHWVSGYTIFRHTHLLNVFVRKSTTSKYTSRIGSIGNQTVFFGGVSATKKRRLSAEKCTFEPCRGWRCKGLYSQRDSLLDVPRTGCSSVFSEQIQAAVDQDHGSGEISVVFGVSHSHF